MQINTNHSNKNNQQTFCSLKADNKAQKILNRRLNSPKKYLYYETLRTSQINNNININLSAYKNRLIAKISPKDSPEISKKESLFSALLKTSPLKFIEKLCIKADRLKKASKEV